MHCRATTSEVSAEGFKFLGEKDFSSEIESLAKETFVQAFAEIEGANHQTDLQRPLFEFGVGHIVHYAVTDFISQSRDQQETCENPSQVSLVDMRGGLDIKHNFCDVRNRLGEGFCSHDLLSIERRIHVENIQDRTCSAGDELQKLDKKASENSLRCFLNIEVASEWLDHADEGKGSEYKKHDHSVGRESQIVKQSLGKDHPDDVVADNSPLQMLAV